MSVQKNQGNCAICMNQQVVWDGTMVLHGYERPGWGHVNGECFGARRKAWQVSPEAAVEYVRFLRARLVTEKQWLGMLSGNEPPALPQQQAKRDSEGRRVLDDAGHAVMETIEVKPGEPKYKELLAFHISKTATRVLHLTNHIEALDARIATWAPAPLLAYDAPPPVEPKPVEIVWEPKKSLYVARRPGTTRSVGEDHDPTALYAAVKPKGWTLPEGVALSARVPTSERLRAVLGGRKPARYTGVNVDRADCVTAGKLLAFYDAADPATRALFDAQPVPRLLRFARDTAEDAAPANVDAVATMARLDLYLALRGRPPERQPSAVLLGQPWRTATFEYHHGKGPTMVVLERNRVRMQDTAVRDLGGKWYFYAWMGDVTLDAEGV